MRDELRILGRAYEIFDSANEMSSDRLRRKLLNLLSDDEFLMAVFKPTVTGDETKEALNVKIQQVFDAASKRSVVSAIADAISDHGYFDLSRASATFLVTLVNLGMATIDTKASDLGREKDHNEISDRDYSKGMAKLNRYQEDLQTILSYAKKIVKPKAKVLSSRSGLPRAVCSMALFSVPGAEYIDTYKTGFYLKTVLGNLYGMVNLTPSEFDTDFDEVDWKSFFGTIFGKDRLPDIASLILLEGASDVEKYENLADVKDCWNALTRFALKALNQAPASIRDQMIELYLKRLNKMLKDHHIDLRVDLRTIDSFRFENLWETVKKYKSKFDDILGAVKKYTDVTNIDD